MPVLYPTVLNRPTGIHGTRAVAARCRQGRQHHRTGCNHAHVCNPGFRQVAARAKSHLDCRADCRRPCRAGPRRGCRLVDPKAQASFPAYPCRRDRDRWRDSRQAWIGKVWYAGGGAAGASACASWQGSQLSGGERHYGLTQAS
jgi:hypothetical protein